MTPAEMKQRTKSFALRAIRLASALPKGPTSAVISYQLIKSSTSVAANYRAACRAKSLADFISKMGIVEEEADESIFWMELLLDAGLITAPRVGSLITEGEQILKIVVASINTAKRRKRAKQSAIRNPQSAIKGGGPRA